MPSVNDQELLIAFAPEASKQVEHARLILPQLKTHNNFYFLKEVEELNLSEQKVWLKFFSPLFYQGLCWVEHGDEAMYLFDKIEDLFNRKSKPSTELSPYVTLYQSQSSWVLHHTKRNWVYKSKKTPSALMSHLPLSTRFGFFESEGISDQHVVEELFIQYSSLKNENAIIKKYRADAFDQFPTLLNPIKLATSISEWDQSWQEIRHKRHSSDAPNSDGIDLADLGRLLDLSLRSDPKKNERARRGYPAAGGFYSECILLELCGVRGINQGCYLYHPHEHALYLIDENVVSTNPVTVIVASRIDLLREKYFKISTRLMLLNTGVILHQLNLACAIMGLNGHPHGTIQQHPWGQKLQTIWRSDWKISARYIIN